MKLALIYNEDHIRLGWASTKARLEAAKDALIGVGLEAKLENVPDQDAFNQVDWQQYDLVWPNVYSIDSNENPVEIVSLVRELEERGLPYIGPSASALETMTHKDSCQHTLALTGLPVPKNLTLNFNNGQPIRREIEEADLTYPVIVKPTNASLSDGITANSVKVEPAQLLASLEEMRQRYTCWIVEEYLPGTEFTAGVIGNGDNQRVYVGEIRIASNGVPYPLLSCSLREQGYSESSYQIGRFSQGSEIEEEIGNMAKRIAETLKIKDYTRLDGRLDSQGQPKVFDINGMPGITINASLTNLFRLYALSRDNRDGFIGVLSSVVDSAAKRYGLEVPATVTEKALYLI